MKRKMFLIVISVLVLCLTCGMLFVACNDKNEGNDNGGKNPGEIDIPDTAADILTEVVKNFGEVKADATGAKEFNLGLDITDADNKPVFSLVFETIDGDDFIYGSVGDGAMTKFNGFDLGGTVETVLSWFLLKRSLNSMSSATLRRALTAIPTASSSISPRSRACSPALRKRSMTGSRTAATPTSSTP